MIDGAENNEPSYVSTGHYEVAQNYTLDGHQRIPEVLLINEGTWDSLTEEDQQLLRTVAEESIDVQRELWDAEVQERTLAASPCHLDPMKKGDDMGEAAATADRAP